MNSSGFPYKPFFRVIALAVLVVLFSGCGGGGGGGTAVAPTPPATGDPPVQSNWSPAKNAYVNTSSFTLTFNTDEPAVCRWASVDVDFSAMASACTTSYTQSHSCAITGLSEGAAYVYVSCADSEGDSDTSATNENISYSVDMSAPSVAIILPEADSIIDLYARSSDLPVVSASYSDDRSGIDVTSLNVTFTAMNRTMSITNLFGKDPSANKSDSRTDESVSDPLARTSVSGFAAGSFTSPAATWTVSHTGNGNTLNILEAGSDRIVVWDTAGAGLWIINVSGGATTEVVLGASPSSVAVSADSGRLYAVFPGDTRLHEYKLSDGSAAGTYDLPGQPALLAHNALLDRLYISYESRLEIGIYDCAAASLSAAVTVAAIPEILAAWPGGDGNILTIADSGGDYKLFEISDAGTILQSVSVTLQIPKGVMVDSDSGYILVSDFSWERVVAVNMSTGATTQITVGNEPRRIFKGSGGTAYVVNSGDRTITPIDMNTLTTGGDIAPAAPPVDGVCLSATGECYLVEDVWDISTQVSVTITASVDDAAGNTGDGSVKIYVNPPVPGE